jgi:hypothetical protein
MALTASVAFAVNPGTYGPDPGSFNSANAPGSSHLTSGSPSCTVNADLSINCSAYVLGGVGHTNATVSLTANYTAIIDCFNPGANRNNPIESHTTSFSPTSSATVASTKNGQLSVPAQSASFSGRRLVARMTTGRPRSDRGRRRSSASRTRSPSRASRRPTSRSASPKPVGR